MVREFLENLRIETSSIKSTIKGTLIVFDERKIGGLLEMPRARCCEPKLRKKKDGLNVILEKEEVTDLGNLSTNQLSMEIRILHNIDSRISKKSKFDWVTEKDIAIMCFLI